MPLLTQSVNTVQEEGLREPIPPGNWTPVLQKQEWAPAGTFLSFPGPTAASFPSALISECCEQPLICPGHQAVSQADFNDYP